MKILWRPTTSFFIFSYILKYFKRDKQREKNIKKKKKKKENVKNINLQLLNSGQYFCGGLKLESESIIRSERKCQ